MPDQSAPAYCIDEIQAHINERLCSLLNEIHDRYPHAVQWVGKVSGDETAQISRDVIALVVGTQLAALFGRMLPSVYPDPDMIASAGVDFVQAAQRGVRAGIGGGAEDV